MVKIKGKIFFIFFYSKVDIKRKVTFATFNFNY